MRLNRRCNLVMFCSGRLFISIIGYIIISAMVVIILVLYCNHSYSNSSASSVKRRFLLEKIPSASPAIVPAGRNIAFETGNALTNAPASYLTMLDCCESDEAIAERIAMGQLTATIIKIHEPR